MKTEDRILINIIGTGYDFRLGRLNDNNFSILSEIENRNDNALNQLLFSEEFYDKNKISDTYKSWNDFNDIGIYRGANLLEKGQIEIWINRKVKNKYSLSEISNATTLFPLFNTEEQYLSRTSHQINIGVQEKGLLSKFVITTPNFLIDKLKFHIAEIKINFSVFKILHAVSYQGVYLKSVKNDTLITGTICEIVK